ncbi:hypothetical protein MKW94_020654 [Papaver nudicaule]|uniref:V-type proton ATPase proteolipid subunit n=1 Tax=Papaver nudicaule TaxID=74823 RepID=A0AA41VVK8_PAPNU|nr:hypothetical protein [Papaver nudicaule]
MASFQRFSSQISRTPSLKSIIRSTTTTSSSTSSKKVSDRIVKLFAIDYKGMGAAYGTSKSGVGVASMGVMRPGLLMKSIVLVVMAGVLGIYGDDYSISNKFLALKMCIR